MEDLNGKTATVATGKMRKMVVTMVFVNYLEPVSSIRIILQGGNAAQLHTELKKLSADEVSVLLLQLDLKEQNQLWNMVPIQ